MPSEGNVYVRGRPVCDDSWGQNEADVVCRFVFVCHQHSWTSFPRSILSQIPVQLLLYFRSLGYSGGSATTNSRFGNAPGGDFGMDDVKCQVTFIKMKIRKFFLPKNTDVAFSGIRRKADRLSVCKLRWLRGERSCWGCLWGRWYAHLISLDLSSLRFLCLWNWSLWH